MVVIQEGYFKLEKLITFVYKINSKRPRFSVILFLFRHFLSNYKWGYLSAFSQIPLTELPQVTFSYTVH